MILIKWFHLTLILSVKFLCIKLNSLILSVKLCIKLNSLILSVKLCIKLNSLILSVK